MMLGRPRAGGSYMAPIDLPRAPIRRLPHCDAVYLASKLIDKTSNCVKTVISGGCHDDYAADLLRSIRAEAFDRGGRWRRLAQLFDRPSSFAASSNVDSVE